MQQHRLVIKYYKGWF